VKNYYSPWGNEYAGPSAPSHMRSLLVGIEIDTSVLEAELGSMDARVEDLSPWLESVWAPWVKATFKKQLLAQGYWMGVGSLWSEDYSERYLRWKAYMIKSGQAIGPVNVKEALTHNMFTSLYRGDVETIGPTAGIIGTDIPYAGVQQGSYPDSMRGTPTRLGQHKPGARKKRPSELAMQGKRKIPIRPPWGHVKEAWKLQLVMSLLDYVMDGKMKAVKP